MTELAPDPGLVPAADEPTTLWTFLDYYRSVLIRKAEGITEEQARLKLGASELTLIGLVRHMAEVERVWFRRRFMGEDCGYLYCGDAADGDDPDGDFHPAATDTVAAAIDALNAEIAHARSVTDGVALDTLARGTSESRGTGWRPSLRWIVVHMIEEYARHCGHADLLREAADGTIGD